MFLYTKFPSTLRPILAGYLLLEHLLRQSRTGQKCFTQTVIVQVYLKVNGIVYTVLTHCHHLACDKFVFPAAGIIVLAAHGLYRFCKQEHQIYDSKDEDKNKAHKIEK